MWGLAPLLLIPFVVMFAFRYKDGGHRFTVKEFVLLEVLMASLLAGGFWMARDAGMADQEIWSGRIVAKDKGTQSCCHCRQVCETCTRTNAQGQSETYSCNCREECDHIRDHYWSLDVSTGDTLFVARCSPSSADPDLWTRAYVGEPAVVEHDFRNYLKADPDSVLRQQAMVAGSGPDYPSVYNVYKIDRVINLGTRMDTRAWNAKLNEVLADLGGRKLVNVNIIATTNPDPAYAQVVERDWLYGKLNDVTFILGAPDGVNVMWAAVVTLPTGNASLRVVGRDALIGSNLADPDATLAKITQVVSAEWRWSGIEDLAYLAWAAKPPLWLHVLLYVLGIAGAAFGSAVMIHHDIFGEEGRFNSSKLRSPFVSNARSKFNSHNR